MSAFSKPALLIGLAAAGAGVWFLSRRAAAAPASAAASAKARLPATNPGRTNYVQEYANGMNMAELLARSVNRGFGIWADLPKTVGASVGSAEARAAIRNAEIPGYYGWAGPTATAVAPDASALFAEDAPIGAALADSVLGGPVYDVGADSDALSWVIDWTG